MVVPLLLLLLRRGRVGTAVVKGAKAAAAAGTTRIVQIKLLLQRKRNIQTRKALRWVRIVIVAAAVLLLLIADTDADDARVDNAQRRAQTLRDLQRSRRLDL